MKKNYSSLIIGIFLCMGLLCGVLLSQGANLKDYKTASLNGVMMDVPTHYQLEVIEEECRGYTSEKGDILTLTFLPEEYPEDVAAAEMKKVNEHADLYTSVKDVTKEAFEIDGNECYIIQYSEGEMMVAKLFVPSEDGVVYIDLSSESKGTVSHLIETVAIAK